jgi:uncharacterized protein YecT (DUF1311 family)
MRLLPIAAACTVIAMATIARGEPVRVAKPIDVCTLKIDAQQVTCLSAKLDAATQSLDTTITTIRSHFPAGAAYLLSFDQAHDAWVKETIQTCRAAAMARGEDADGAFDLRCRIDITVAREQLLKKLYAGQ